MSNLGVATSPITIMNEQKLTKKLLLSYVSDYEIFKRYFRKDFLLGVMYVSPLRNEERPSFNIFRHYNGTLLYKDFAGGSGDCFRYVANLKKIKVSEALELIANDFTVKFKDEKYERSPEQGIIGTREKTMIDIRTQPFDLKDVMYWSQYGITGETLKKFNVKPLSQFRINNSKWFLNNSNILIYAYIFENSTKIYKPLDTSGYKWISNCNSQILQGWKQLPKVGHNIVITKSLKDVMVLYEYGIPAVAPHGETINIESKVIDELKKRFNNVWVLYDTDRAGYINSAKICRMYNLKRFFIQTQTCIWKSNIEMFGKIKDISDYRAEFGDEETYKFLKRIRLT